MGVFTDVVGISPSLYYESRLINDKVASKSNQREISRLISAAIINKNFCQMLLKNPRKALRTGFQGEAFFLNTEQKNMIFSIQAESLEDFAAQLVN